MQNAMDKKMGSKPAPATQNDAIISCRTARNELS